MKKEKQLCPICKKEMEWHETGSKCPMNFGYFECDDCSLKLGGCQAPGGEPEAYYKIKKSVS